MSWLHAVVDVPAGEHERAAVFWGGALGWTTGEAWPRHPELRSFEPPAGAAYVHLQQIDGPPRVHLDLEAEDPGALVARATALGAELVARHEEWLALTSPGGLPFCVLTAREHEAPEPVAWPDGHRTRLVQVCIDSPVDVHDAEVSFWQVLLGHRWALSDRDEFAGKWHDDAGSPVQLLFQRLEEPTGPVRAHIDLGTDDLVTDVRRLRDLGAIDIGPGHGWHALSDPSGVAFCVTENPPSQTLVREFG